MTTLLWICQSVLSIAETPNSSEDLQSVLFSCIYFETHHRCYHSFHSAPVILPSLSFLPPPLFCPSISECWTWSTTTKSDSSALGEINHKKKKNECMNTNWSWPRKLDFSIRSLSPSPSSSPALLVLSALLQVLCSGPVCSVSRSGHWSIQGAVMIPHIQERLALNLPATVGIRAAVRGEKPSPFWSLASVTLAEHQDWSTT